MRLPSIRPREDREQPRSQKRNVKIALTGRVKEFPAESRLRSWLRRTGEIAKLPIYGGEYALYMGRRGAYGIAFAVVAVTVLLAFLPHLRSFVWPGIAWVLLVVSAIVVLGVVVNILVVVLSMYIGYRPANEELDGTRNGATGVQGEVVPFDGWSHVGSEPTSPWADALNNLRSAEYALSKLEGNVVFRSLTDAQKSQYYQVLGEMQTLIREISDETSQEKVAS
jgi:hypothetical protein